MQDNETLDMFASAAARRQRVFAAKQKQMGRKARKIWATDEEINALRKFLETLREEERS
jgi:hypothetical protein